VAADADPQDEGDGTDYGQLVPADTVNAYVARVDVQVRLTDRAGNQRTSQVFAVRPIISQWGTT
jgi:hypothetical protein